MLCKPTEKEADGVRSLVDEVAVLTGTFNLSDYIWLCRNLPSQLSITTEWALAELISHLDMLKTAREEIDSVVGTWKEQIGGRIQNLPYLQAIVKETLRLHQAILRESTEDCTQIL
ncbi:hypothetical protein IFM89_017248 [Coptis chinensis]|uniref:Uncharacterized protein n=1 Tax=Coptis chinensis TaxID=261450 RepID=A0A835HDY6_9MAGN|nr:hypothetical protein IFM89_017248 [Coptis chinensis]